MKRANHKPHMVLICQALEGVSQACVKASAVA